MVRLLAAICVIVCSAAAAEKTNAGPARLRVLTYNIQIGTGMDKRVDLERTAAVIRSASPDIVALQEVDRKARRTDGVDQAAELARLTGMQMVFGKASVREGIDQEGGSYGVAILSRWPIKRHQNRPLPYTRGFELRTVLEADIEWPKTPVRFFATHFDNASAADRQSAAQLLVQLAKAKPSAPSILAGDLNALPESEPLKTLTEMWESAGAGPTFRADKPARQLDYVFFRPADRWKVVEYKVLDESMASDHRPVFAVLEFKAK